MTRSAVAMQESQLMTSKIPETLLQACTLLPVPGSLISVCTVSASDLFWAHDPAISVYVQGGHAGVLRMRDSGIIHEHRLRRDDICICPEDWSGELAFSSLNDFMTVRLLRSHMESIFAEGLRGSQLEIVMKRGIQDPQIINICRALEVEALNGGPSGQLFTEALITALCARLLAAHGANSFRPPRYRDGLPRHALRLAVEYIQANLTRDMHLEEIAALVNISPYYFARLFRKSTGLAPHQYVRSLRVERAKGFLVDSTKSIVEVALAVGYGSQSHFTTVFRKATGYTPKQYRNYFPCVLSRKQVLPPAE